jgi:maleate cis-trans isomerase
MRSYKNLARVIQKGVEIREESHVQDKGYQKMIAESVEEAVKVLNVHPTHAEVARIMLLGAWNESIIWARNRSKGISCLDVSEAMKRYFNNDRPEEVLEILNFGYEQNWLIRKNSTYTWTNLGERIFQQEKADLLERKRHEEPWLKHQKKFPRCDVNKSLHV